MSAEPYDEPPPDDEHVPPQDIAAERSVLGSILIDREALDDCLELVDGPDFYRPHHERIWDAALAVHRAGEPADAITVADELTKRGELTRAGGQAYLHDLVQSVAITTNAGYYAEIVHERAVLRRLETAGTRIVQMSRGVGEGDLDDIVNRAAGEVVAIADTHHATATVSHETAVYEAVADLDSPPGIETPWTYLTTTLAGWKPGALYIVGARPGVGKSVAGTDIALDIARRGHAAALYSLEMTRSELMHRLFAHVGAVPMDRIQHRKLNDDDRRRIAEAASSIARLPLHVDDRARLSLAQIHASVRSLQRTRDVGIVVIDYLQLIAPPPGTPREDRRVQVDAISRGLKQLAKDLDVPVVALTQLNRGPEQRADKTPTLSDLREAGGIEQDADAVILLHRNIHGDDSRVLHVAVGKNRHGPGTAFDLVFVGEHSRIDNPSWGGRTTP